MDHLGLHAFPRDEAAARALGSAMGLALNLVHTHRFPDGEIVPRVSGAAHTVLVYCSLANPNEKLVELMLACDAWRRAGAARLVLVAPYLCYMRQDAMFAPGEPISQKVVGALLGRLFERIVTVDAHLHRTAHLEDLAHGVQWTNLRAASEIAEHLRRAHLPEETLIVGPDAESAQWVGSLGAEVELEAATFLKSRQSDRQVTLEFLEATKVRGRPVLLLDDICSSGGTLAAAVALLAERGAGPIDIIVTHALFSAQTEMRLINAGVRNIQSCDSCNHPTNAIPLAPLLARALEEERAQ